MSSRKTKRDKEEKKLSNENNKIESKGTKVGEKRGRIKKIVTEEEKKKILEEVDKEIESYKKTIELNENDFISYSPEEMSDLESRQNNKKLSKMIQIYIHKLNEEGTNKYVNEINFAKKLKKIIYILNMNENEFAYFTLLLEKIGWDCSNNFEIFEHLHYVGILAMQYSSDKFKNKTSDKFKIWKNENKIKDDELKAISLKDINLRIEELSINQDKYELDEFLDYNQMVDDIIMKARIYQDNNKK